MRVVLAEDLYLLRTGLERLLGEYGFEVIESVDNGPGYQCELNCGEHPDTHSQPAHRALVDRVWNPVWFCWRHRRLPAR